MKRECKLTPDRNPLATYTEKAGELSLSEQHLYGAKRLGMRNSNLLVASTDGHWDNSEDKSEKRYELTNHLGNVLAVVSGEKAADGSAQILSLTDYYPFGMEMDGRKYVKDGGYRYGFNGQEKTSELDESHTTALFWEYDGRLGRRWNMDPKSSPTFGCYATFGCNPILLSDVLGDSSVVDNEGYIIGPVDREDKRVFMRESEDTDPVFIGEFGGTINADKWLSNLINANYKFAKGKMCWYKSDYWLFKNMVGETQIFDYKYRTENTKGWREAEREYKDDREHLLGYAFYFSDDDKDKGVGKENGSVVISTTFNFGIYSGMRAEDVNQFHYGALGIKLGLDETLLKVMPGWSEQDKQKENKEKGRKYNEDYEKWRNFEYFGDNPADAVHVRNGIRYGKTGWSGGAGVTW